MRGKVRSMLSRSKVISNLLEHRTARESYVRAKLNQLIPSQIRALRLRQEWSQKELGDAAEMKQARISAIETPGVVNFSLETLVRIAAALRVGLQVRFLPYSEMLCWENDFSQDSFSVTKIEQDDEFLDPHSRNEQDAIGVLASGLQRHAVQGRDSSRNGIFEFDGIVSQNVAAGGSEWMHQ